MPDVIDARLKQDTLTLKAAQDAFRAKLPDYLVRGLEYVTGFKKDPTEEPPAEAAVAHA